MTITANVPNAEDTFDKLDLKAEPSRGPRRAVFAPGAVRSPQMPGQVPDRSSVPGQYSKRVPKVASAARPLTQAQTAEGRLGLFNAPPGEELTPEDFEQAPPSYEEQRKALWVLLPPTRPMPGEPLAAIEASETTAQAVAQAEAIEGDVPPALPPSTS